MRLWRNRDQNHFNLMGRAYTHKSLAADTVANRFQVQFNVFCRVMIRECASIECIGWCNKYNLDCIMTRIARLINQTLNNPNYTVKHSWSEKALLLFLRQGVERETRRFMLEITCNCLLLQTFLKFSKNR